MAQTITDLFLTVWKLGPEWGKGAIIQDGQVTMLDLPKAHGIPYMEAFSLSFSTKVVGKGIQFPWLGVLFGSIPVSKSLGNQIGQVTYF